MNYAYFTRGLPASGKSTTAADLGLRTNTVVLAKDEIREWLCPKLAYHSCDLFFVERMRDVMLRALLEEEKDVILDETFIECDDLERAITIVREYETDLVLIDLTNVSFDECYDRDSKRHRRVGFDSLFDAYLRLSRNEERFENEFRNLFSRTITPYR